MKHIYGITFKERTDVDTWHLDVSYFDLFDEYGKLQKPVAYLTCNFNRMISGKPALFTNNEVITLFHEFGHMLHHMLTRIDTPGVASFSGVPWDAVELPRQFIKIIAVSRRYWRLSPISLFIMTSEPLSNELLNKLLEAKNIRWCCSFYVS